MPNIFMVLNTAPRGTALSRTDQKEKKNPFPHRIYALMGRER